MYADDHQIFHSGHNLEEVKAKLSVSAAGSGNKVVSGMSPTYWPET